MAFAHRNLALALSALLATSAAWAQTDAGFPAPTGDSSIIAAGTKVERLFDADCFAEGPSVGPDNMVYFSDITFTKFCIKIDNIRLRVVALDIIDGIWSIGKFTIITR